MLNDFKAFILRGNVVDLAVGIVIGAAFGTVVSSLVRNILTPLLAVPGTANFADQKVVVSGSEILYGLFLNDLISFLTIAAGTFFLVVRPINALMARRRTEPEIMSTTRNCPHCMSSIPQEAEVCAFCTREVANADAATDPGGDHVKDSSSVDPVRRPKGMSE